MAALDNCMGKIASYNGFQGFNEKEEMMTGKSMYNADWLQMGQIQPKSSN